MSSNRLFNIVIGKKGVNLWIFSSLVLFSFIAALLEGVSFGFLLTAFSGLQSNGMGHLTLLKRLFLPEVQGIRLFITSTILAIIFQMLRSGVCYLSTIFSTQFGCNIQGKIQSEIYNQILSFSYGFISRQKVGELIENARSPVTFTHPMLEGINRLLVSVLTALVIVVLMINLSLQLTCLTLCLFGFFVYIQKSIVKTILSSSYSMSKQLMEVNQATSQMLQGIKVIQTFSQQEQIKSKVNVKISEIGMTSKKIYLLSNIIPYLNEMISVLILCVILLSSMVIIGIESESFLTILMTFLLISYRLSTRVQNAIGVLGTTSTYYGYLKRVNDILKNSDKEFLPTGGAPCTETMENIAIQGVSFRYPAGKEDALHDISFQIDKGVTIGIVGLSGSGKTSLIDLLLRLYEPNKGSICVNGKNIQSFSIDSWRSKFGVVGQDSFLFDETILYNTRFGSEEASMEAVTEAAKAAGIHSLIQRLSLGYETVVGERGLRLSGGERQRIALARALLRNPEILILDEATSNLDSQSEHYIQNAIEKLHKTKTIILIAHRLSTLVQADIILVIEHGTVVESGSHKELIDRKGRYANLWDLQTQSENNQLLIGV